MAYIPKHLNRWKLPRDYFGAHWDGWYVFLSRHRDSDCLTRSNFECGKEAVLPLADLTSAPDGDDPEALQSVMVISENHWAVGWIEWVGIHESNEEALRVADEIAAKLEDYPVVNEDHFSEMEYGETLDCWERCSVRERLYYCQKAGVSPFAARHAEFPDDPCGRLFEAVRPD